MLILLRSIYDLASGRNQTRKTPKANIGTACHAQCSHLWETIKLTVKAITKAIAHSKDIRKPVPDQFRQHQRHYHGNPEDR